MSDLIKSFKQMLVVTKKTEDCVLGFMTYGENVGELEKRKKTMTDWFRYSDTKPDFMTFDNLPSNQFKIVDFAGRYTTQREWVRVNNC